MIRKSGYRFSERSCSNKKIERDDDSKKSHPALATKLVMSRRRRRIAPDDESRHDKAFALFAKTQILAARIRDLAASGGDDRVSRRDIPFAGGGEAGINVGSALRHAAEFDRRAERLPARAWPRPDKGFSPYIPVRSADGHDPGSAAWRQRAGMDRLGRPHGRFPHQQPFGASTHHSSPYQSECRRADDAQDWRRVRHQREIDRKLVAAGDKFLGAVKRIDQKETAAIRWLCRMNALLG